MRRIGVKRGKRSSSPANDLLRAHVRTLFTVDDRDRLLTVNEPAGGPAPRFFIARAVEGVFWWFRHDLDEGVVSRLEEQARREPEVRRTDEFAFRPDPYLEILQRAADVKRVWAGPAFHFPEEIAGGSAAVLVDGGRRDVLRRYCSGWLDDVSDCQPFVVVLEGEDAVSLCATVRRSDVAEEAGVETHPDFRGRGLAGEVTAAWAREVRRVGRIPLYSTSWTNGASIAVARGLGLIRYAATLHIT